MADSTGNSLNGSAANKTIDRKSVPAKTPAMSQVKALASVKVRCGPMKKA